eukprot:GHRR01036538.1.p1 GENE.GHRR01036538.1~~GHRR01036538.1.p1  ORF type:complete len:115 (-),score=20.52 GHRR01036538.1:54-398(-)
MGEEDAEAVTRAYLARAVEEAEREAAANAPIEEEGEELCNCEFSLAYGAKILLNNATMRLIRGRRYGLCGPNGVGKSTLMRAIANGQVCAVIHDLSSTFIHRLVVLGMVPHLPL